ncbi:MAG: hypothetical protein OHK0039_22000 [Bacteroidia bacterium]
MAPAQFISFQYIRTVWLLLLSLSLASCSLLRQAGGSSAPPIDRNAEELIAQGKRLFQTNDYADAMDAFEMARDREFHRSTTLALYLAGLSAYYAGYDDIATQRFTTLHLTYPRSRYNEEARYHECLIHLRNWREEDRFRGLDTLFAMAGTGSNAKLRADARTQVQHYLFDTAELSDVQAYYQHSSRDNRQTVMEALVYRLFELKRYDEAKARYEAYKQGGGRDSEYLKGLFAKLPTTPEPAPLVEPDIVRIALFLPLFNHMEQNLYGNTLPEETLRGLEFYEGVQKALDEYAARPGAKKVFLKVYDTRRDSLWTRGYLQELDSLRPQLIIGAIFNAQSKVLSEWAEANQVPQIVPISPSEELVQDKDYVFLAHPAAVTHGASMATYAYQELGLAHVSVFSDRSAATQPMADGFCETFARLGGTVDTFYIDPDYRKYAIREIPSLISEIPYHLGNVGVYIPLMNNEESAGLIVNLLKQRNKKVVVMGSPHFRSRYSTLGRETKEGFNLLFTTSYMIDPADTAYQRVYSEQLRDFSLPPTENFIQGYDMGRYVFQVMDTYDPRLRVPLESYLRVFPRFEGLHLDYYFHSSQSNQQVNIGQYTPEGILKVQR